MVSGVTSLPRRFWSVPWARSRPTMIVLRISSHICCIAALLTKWQVIALYKDTGGADFVGCQLALAERDTATVAALGVIHGDAAFHRGFLTCLDELHLLGDCSRPLRRYTV